MLNRLKSKISLATLLLCAWVSPGTLAFSAPNESTPLKFYLHSQCKLLQDFELLSSYNFNLVLDCLSRSVPANKLGMQWHILKASGWKIILSVQRAGEMELANDPFRLDAEYSYFLAPPQDMTELIKELHDLESRVFPRLLDGVSISNQASTVDTFNTSMYRAVELATRYSPLRNVMNYISPAQFNSNDDYVGGHYPDLAKVLKGRFANFIRRNNLQARDWPDLWEFYLSLHPCHSQCLEKMESKIIRGQLLLFSSKELVNKVFSDSVRRYGCYDHDTVFGKTIFTSNFQRYIHFSRNSLIGRPMYFSSINGSLVDDKVYQGMNGVIRDVSQDAWQDYQSLGTMGGNLSLTAQYDTPPKVADLALSGLSQIVASYWEYRHNLNKTLKPKEAQKLAAQKYLNRPVFTDIRFEPTWLLGGAATLKDWVEKLYSLNPRTPYQVTTYNYSSRNFYDKVLAAVDTFPSLDQAEFGEYNPPSDLADRVYSNYTFVEIWHSIF